MISIGNIKFVFYECFLSCNKKADSHTDVMEVLSKKTEKYNSCKSYLCQLKNKW